MPPSGAPSVHPTLEGREPRRVWCPPLRRYPRDGESTARGGEPTRFRGEIDRPPPPPACWHAQLDSESQARAAAVVDLNTRVEALVSRAVVDQINSEVRSRPLDEPDACESTARSYWRHVKRTRTESVAM